MKLRVCACLALASMVSASSAHAGIIFSDVQISGSLAGGASFMTGATDIDFFFPDAFVGDPTVPELRSGNIMITYLAHSDTAALVQDQLLLSVLGALSGSGMIHFNEVVEDMVTPGIIATHKVQLNQFSQLPHVATLNFSRPSSWIKVKKTLTLTAPETPALDFASVGLIEQNLHQVPEPGSLALIGLGAVGMMTRRRR